jgi:hypothetical protein
MLEYLINMNPTRGEQKQSPLTSDPSPSFPAEMMQSMQEIRIGDYLVKSERISGNSIGGYSMIMLINSEVYEGEMSRSRKK